ncbi:MAG: hypothetical protein ABJB66_20490, partial [Gemmatimonadaceae bacterium]
MTTLLMPAILFSQATSTATKEARAIADSALARVIANASEMNRLPPDLIAYKANVQTELALVQRLSSGTERPLLAEQLASSLRWTRAGTYTQNVVGYRTQEIGLSYALLFLQTPWLNPVLYGNRLRSLAQFVADSYNPDSDRRRPATRPPRVLSHDDSLRLKRVLPPAGADSAQRQRPRPPRADDTIAIIHPLALDRNRYYQYSRGDTLVTLHSGDRSIPIVRVHVEPRADVKDSVALFVGDMDLDVSRGALVRMRGYFARAEVVRRRGIL